MIGGMIDWYITSVISMTIAFLGPTTGRINKVRIKTKESAVWFSGTL